MQSWPWLSKSLKTIERDPVSTGTHDFLLVIPIPHYGSPLYRFRDFVDKREFFLTHVHAPDQGATV